MGRRRIYPDDGQRNVAGKVEAEIHKAFRNRLVEDELTAAYVVPELVRLYAKGEIVVEKPE